LVVRWACRARGRQSFVPADCLIEVSVQDTTEGGRTNQRVAFCRPADNGGQSHLQCREHPGTASASASQTFFRSPEPALTIKACRVTTAGPITLDGHRLLRLHREPTLPSQHHFGINISGSARGRAPRIARAEVGSRCRLRRTATMAVADGAEGERTQRDQALVLPLRLRVPRSRSVRQPRPLLPIRRAMTCGACAPELATSQ